MGAAETRRAIEAAQRALPAWKHRTREGQRAHPAPPRRPDAGATPTSSRRSSCASRASRSSRRSSRSPTPPRSTSGSARRRSGSTAASIPQPLPDRRIVALREPIGVTAGITPWNFPAAMPTRKSAPALAVGCTMVLKPAEQTPLTRARDRRARRGGGRPAGVFSIVTGDAADAPAIGGEMTSNPIVRKLGFTGSTEVGKLLMAQCAGAGQEGLARARRQRAVHRLRRRRPRGGGRRAR